MKTLMGWCSGVDVGVRCRVEDAVGRESGRSCSGEGRGGRICRGEIGESLGVARSTEKRGEVGVRSSAATKLSVET